MNTHDNNRSDALEVLVLGIASADTAGTALNGEEIGGRVLPGISEE